MNDPRQDASARGRSGRRGVMRRVAILVVFYIVSLAVLYAHMVLWPQRLQVGQLARVTVLSPIDFSYLDEHRLRELTGSDTMSNQVKLIDGQMVEQALLRISTFQDEIAELQRQLAEKELTPTQRNTRVEEISSRYQLESVVVDELLKMKPEDLLVLLADAQEKLSGEMDGAVTRTLIDSLKSGGTPELLAHPDILYAYFLLPNLKYGPPPGQKLRQLAQMNVKKGSPIVTAGTVVTESQVERLKQIDPQIQHIRLVRLAGIALLQLGAMLLWSQYLRRYASRILLRFGALVQFSVLYMAFLITGILIGRLTEPSFAYAVSFAVVALTSVIVMVYDASLAIYFGLGLGAVLAFALNFGPDLMAYTLGAALLPGVILAPGCRKMVQLLFAILMGLFNALLALSAGLLATHSTEWSILLTAFIAGAAAAIVALGLLPVVEAVSSQLTPGKLMELANPENELLRRLKREAPGTFAHCHGVADLAEEGAKAVSGNWLHARVGALYHDIGKLRRPGFFAENIHDLAQNPHQGLPPESSVRILRDHVGDGLNMAREIRLPQELQRYIAEHHGTYLIKYFYYEAQRLHASDPNTYPEPQIEDFSYTGPLPSTRESAIVMLADVCEAVFRSRGELEPEEMELLLDDLFSEKLEEDQLLDSGLTVGDLSAIRGAFLRYLLAQRHQRPAYPVQRPSQIQFHYLETGKVLAGRTSFHD